MFVGCAPAILRPSGLLSALRPQDVFATSLYTGTGASQTINNGLDLLGKGGLTWFKARNSNTSPHGLYDTVRGRTTMLSSSGTSSEADYGSSPTGNDLASFNSNGFSLGSVYTGVPNTSGNTMAAWSFRRASKFFDIVTYTGDGTSGRVIPHALGIKPGMIIVKRRDAVGSWPVYHGSIGATKSLFLEATNASGATVVWNNAEPTATDFTVGSQATVNAAGGLYVAYLFAHDLDTTNGIVQCGSFTTDGNGAASVTLGWQPQWLLFKASSGTSQWYIVDTTRGWAGSNKYLYPNLSNAEGTLNNGGSSNATGFTIAAAEGFVASTTFVFLAIRAPI